MKWLVEEPHPEAEIIWVILNNLNAPKPASLHGTFLLDATLRIRKEIGLSLHTQTWKLAQYG